MTVRQLLASMDARELAEWEAFASIEPIGEQRADLRAGIVASTIYNSWCSPARGASDFMPDFWKEPEKPPTPQQIGAKLKAIFGGMRPPAPPPTPQPPPPKAA